MFFILIVIAVILVFVIVNISYKRKTRPLRLGTRKVPNEMGMIYATRLRMMMRSPLRKERTRSQDGFVVFLGDSVASGEAGRWAGNTHTDFSAIDVGGIEAYYDNADKTAETTTGCHRSNTIQTNLGPMCSVVPGNPLSLLPCSTFSHECTYG
jgi:hypothetical protein